MIILGRLFGTDGVRGIANTELSCVHNTGFHMGWESITIDFDREIPAEDLPEIERAVNEAIWRDQPVKCWYPSQEELPQVFYRTKKALPWPVRIVQVGDVDSCACCGVHVARTGEIGLVKLFSCVKFRSGSRIEMLCGGRALDYLNRVWQQNALVSHAFSAKALETGAAAEKMNEVLAQQKYRITGLENRIFDAIAEGCRGTSVIFEPDWILWQSAVWRTRWHSTAALWRRCSPAATKAATPTPWSTTAGI